jgi:hypothetical protein
MAAMLSEAVTMLTAMIISARCLELAVTVKRGPSTLSSLLARIMHEGWWV